MITEFTLQEEEQDHLKEAHYEVDPHIRVEAFGTQVMRPEVAEEHDAANHQPGEAEEYPQEKVDRGHQ